MMSVRLTWIPTVPCRNSLSAAGAVHLWAASLCPTAFPQPVIEQWYASTLSEAERQKANTVRCFPSYVASRAFLRQTLALYVDVSPGQLELRRHRRGKPFIAGVSEPPEFSLTHTDQVGVIAVASCGRPVGIDLELSDRRVRSLEKMVNRFMTEDERRWIGTSQEKFLHVWVAKEAIVKGLGEGIAGEVRLGDFHVRNDRPLVLMSRAWSIMRFNDLPLNIGKHFGAVAIASDKGQALIRRDGPEKFLWTPGDG